MKQYWVNNRRRIRVWFLIFLAVLYIVYFSYAMHYDFHVGLLVITLLLLAAVSFYYVQKRFGPTVYKKTHTIRKSLVRHWKKWIKW